ncbi:MAG: NAD(P)/FAD-dependent oxidoreductase [Chloroflexota bacterium]|nr:NAD(P)/FAD-dependent oxidoreductase [Chloroflexota bacterium]
MDYPRVVIVGAGFAGMKAARKLAKAPVDILLVDENNFHTFQPLLYQVATAALEPEEVAHAARGIFHDQDNFNFRLAKVTGVDWDTQTLEVADGDHVPFDYLILAAGAVTNYFGIEGVEENAFPLKSLAEAVNLRSHIIYQFEHADTNPGAIDEGVLNFVIVGGGPTGVEMAGSLIELFDYVLVNDYPEIEVECARVILIEMMDHLLAPFHEKSREYALEVLRKRGVEVMLNEAVVRATPTEVHLESGKVIPTRTLIWAAGVRANPLADNLGLEQTRGGRVVVNDDLSVPGHPNVFVVGDMAASKDKEGNVHPQLAQVALQGATHAAKQIERRLSGKPTKRFDYFDPGIMATVGRNAAATELPGGIRFTGFIAWLAWLFLHLMYLVGFRNRLNVFVNWWWNYITFDRSARLIFEVEPELAEVSRRGQIERGWSGEKVLEHPLEEV